MAAPKRPEIHHIDVTEMIEKYTEVCSIFTDQFGIDARLNADQLFSLLAQLGGNMTAEQVDTLWDEMDRDKTGDISCFELLHFIFDMDGHSKRLVEDFKGLAGSNVYARIRPIGKDGHTMGEAVDKELDGWTDESIFVKDRHEREEFTFPTKVLTPESTQEETYSTVMNEIVDAWLMNCLNCLLLAYGQTGTGKTHTMFGSRESLTSDDLHPDWGIFPRAVHHCLSECKKWETFTEMYTSSAVSLRAYAIEFYMAVAYDLVGERAPLLMTPNGEPIGANSVEITRVSDLAPFLDMVAKNRTMSATKMNAGSSRSHCALILELFEGGTSKADPTMWTMKRTLTLVDMAGSERPTKTGAVRIGIQECYALMMKEAAGGKIRPEERTGMEAFVINSQLTALRTEIEQAAKLNTGKKKYINNVFGNDPFLRMIGRSLVGELWMNAIVCISQSPQNGWETWFSCGYGQGLAKLQAPLKKVKPIEADKLKKKLADDLAKAKKKFESTPEPSTGKPASKWWPLRKAVAKQAADDVELLETIEKRCASQLKANESSK